MLVKDIIGDARNIYGKCDDAVLFDFIEKTIEVLKNKGQWDPQVGYADICASNQKGCYTLPVEIETPLAVSVNGVPSMARDQWYEFHVNGLGSCGDNYGGGGGCSWFWDDRGDVPTIRDIQKPAQLMAIPQSAQDNGKKLIIYGYDQNNRVLQRDDGTGVMIDGIEVPMDAANPYPTPNTILVKRIERITREATAQPVKVFAIDPDTGSGYLINWFYGYETQPSYRRIRVGGGGCGTIRMKFRKRSRPITSLEDYIPLTSKMAMVCMMRAIKLIQERGADQLSAAEALERKAIQYLNDEQATRNAVSSIGIQIDVRSTNYNETIYGDYGRYYGGWGD